MVHMYAALGRFLIMSDEAVFSLNSSVNKQNCWYWAPTNPRQLHKRPLHSPEVIVWCAISAKGIIGPYFFEVDDGVSVTVNAERYNHMLETFFLPEMRRHNWNMSRAWFQQDSATAHTARLSMNTLHAAVPGRLLSWFGDIQWPSNSPDLNVADFFVRGYLKAQVFTHTLPVINSLKNVILQEISNVMQDTLRRIMTSVPGRWQQCLDCHGGRLQDVLKTWGFFGESKTLTYLTVFSCIYCCVQ
jgi:hypothetical protein